MAKASELPTSIPMPAKAPTLPASVTLRQTYGFIEDDGTRRNWPAGYVETDPDMIAILVERAAPLKD